MLASLANSLVFLNKLFASEIVKWIQIDTVFAMIIVISKFGNQDIVEQIQRILECCGLIEFD